MTKSLWQVANKHDALSLCKGKGNLVQLVLSSCSGELVLPLNGDTDITEEFLEAITLAYDFDVSPLTYDWHGFKVTIVRQWAGFRYCIRIIRGDKIFQYSVLSDKFIRLREQIRNALRMKAYH